MQSSVNFDFMMIVSDPEIAAFVSQNGVKHLFVDLEKKGKLCRQRNLNTVISQDTPDTVSKIRQVAPNADVIVRLNPLNRETPEEVENVIDRGADAVMLPFFHDEMALEKFVTIVADRVRVVPLVETIGSLKAVERFAGNVVIDRVHFGLNDLHLERGDKMMFCPLIKGILDAPIRQLKKVGLQFGIGGLARAGEGLIPPEILIGEHVRLGSTQAILSRTFHRNASNLDELCKSMDFPLELKKLLEIYQRFKSANAETLNSNHKKLMQRAEDFC